MTSDDGPVEEELTAGARRTLPRWAWLLGGAIVVAAAAVALVVGVRGRDEPSAGAGSAAPSLSSLARLTPISTLPVSPLPLPAASSAPCSASTGCRVSTELPAAVGAALRTYYPEARVTGARTVTAVRDGERALVRRTLTVIADRRRISVVLTPYVLGPDDFDRRTSGRVSTVTVRGTTYGGARSGASVQLTLVEPATESPNDIVVLRLARDPRLAALR